MSRRSTVLVVDDEPSIRVVCRVNLEFDGYRVLEAANAAEARAALAEEPVDVLLLDVHLGMESGLELLQRLREEGSTVPTILLTGSADDVSRGSVLADGIVGKPFELEELSAAVGRLAGHSKSGSVDSAT